MENILETKVTGYFTLVEYPDSPEADFPTTMDCEGYIFISMVQLCNLAEKYGLTRSCACDAFGGDNGDIPVPIVRKAWICREPGHRRKKFVLISAVEKYFREVGVEWE